MTDVDTKQLKPGDEVAVSTNYGRAIVEVWTVASVSPTGRVKTTNGVEFNADGRVRGQGSGMSIYRHRLVPLTDNVRAAAARRDLVERVADRFETHKREGWTRLTRGDLLSLLALLDTDEGDDKKQ